jgi:probable LLM family oxidoreductase
MNVELGISSFGETTPLKATGKAISHSQRIKDLLAEIILADQVGVDVFAIGEHHRKDFAVSAPEIVLAMAAAKTKRIHLSSATTNLPTIDPIRVYEQYATMTAVYPGRIEIMAGRGSFTEAFDIFGYNLADYDDLFEEKLKLLLEINKQKLIDWPGGKYTPKLDHQGIYPSLDKPLTISLATGGSPESTIRAAELGLPVVYALIGGKIDAFAPLLKLYRAVNDKLGHDPKQTPIAAHSWGWLTEDNEKAIKDYYYPVKLLTDAISKEREQWQELSYDQYLEMVNDDGVIFAGDSEHVANKIIKMMETLNLQRFYLHLPVASMPHEEVMRAIKIYGKEVIPKVKNHFAQKEENKHLNFQWKR